MKTIDLIGTSIAGILLIITFISLFISRQKIKSKKQEIIKLQGLNRFNIFLIILGLLMIGVSFLKLNINFIQFIFWLLLGINALIQGLIHKREMIILDTKGIKELSLLNWELMTDNRIKWNSLIDIRRNESKTTEIIFETSRKNLTIDFYNDEKINDLKSLIKRLSPKTYDLFLNEKQESTVPNKSYK